MRWPHMRDIVITGTGLAIVWSQLLLWALGVRVPSAVLLGVGVAFTLPAATAHVRTVLGTPEAGPSSSSLPPPPPPPSSPLPLPEGSSGE